MAGVMDARCVLCGECVVASHWSLLTWAQIKTQQHALAVCGPLAAAGTLAPWHQVYKTFSSTLNSRAQRSISSVLVSILTSTSNKCLQIMSKTGRS